MATQAIDSTGVKLEIKPYGSSTWVEVGEVVNIGGPDNETTIIKASTLRSPDGFHEFIAGMTDAGEFDCTINYTKGAVQGFLDMITNRRAGAHEFRITIPDGTTPATDSKLEGKFIVKTYKVFDIQLDDKITAKFTMKLTGNITWTAGT